MKKRKVLDGYRDNCDNNSGFILNLNNWRAGQGFARLNSSLSSALFG